MNIRDLFEEDEREHFKALNDTGYYGRQAAGCLPFCPATQHFLIAHRSRHVEQPHTWGTWGGAINDGENPQQAVHREFSEESGYSGRLKLIPLYVFKDKAFRYSNFLAMVEQEFEPIHGAPYPKPGWETQDFRWCAWGDWPQPMHFGLKALLADAASVATIERVMTQTRPVKPS